MKFSLTYEYIDLLKEAIEKNESKYIQEQSVLLHAVDIAEIFDRITIQEARYFFTQISDKEKAADVIVELEEDIREELLEGLSGNEIAALFIDNVNSDDAADILNELSDDLKNEVIQQIHKQDIEQASDIIDLLNYEEDTAGGLMGKEYIQVNINWTSERCIQEIRTQAQEIDQVYTVYVVNDNDVLKGIISLKKLILVQVDTQVSDIYDESILSVNASCDSEEVANIMQKYDLIALPVVDEIGRLIGRITIDDVVDVIKEEAEKDYQLISGITQDVEHTDNVWMLTKARLPWLLIGLIGGIVGAKVIGNFEDTIRINPEMAFFIPLIAAMGGNVGVQSSSIIVQGLANKSIEKTRIFLKLFKELLVGLANGFICSILILGYNLLFNQSLDLSATVSAALLVVIVFASVFGSFVPLVLNKYKIDPAVATGPFITTINDVLGLLLYFAIGRIMYGIF